MTTYTPGQSYTFQVIGIKEENDTKYIYLSDGYKDTYRVKPYDYQLEWEEFNIPSKMNCFVKDVNIWGLPYLVQDRKDVLDFCYADIKTEYPFKAVNIGVDTNTNAVFYELKDSFGLYHRYYPKNNEPKHEIGDIFNLVVNSISDKGFNKVTLNLEYPIELIVTKEIATHEVSNDPREESKFGYESATKEFKTSIVFPAGAIEPNIDRQLTYILKTIAGFQNAQGGELYIGINDSGSVSGINEDFKYLNTSDTDLFTYPENKDGFELKIRNTVKHIIGGISNSHIDFQFNNESKKDYVLLEIKEVNRPVFVNGIKLFQRTGNMTQLLKGDEITYFVENRLQLRKSEIKNIETTDSLVEELIPEISKVIHQTKSAKVEIPHFNLPTIDSLFENDKIWYYLTLYSSGEWSFQKKSATDSDVMIEIPIYNNCKKGRILMVYHNGCVNTVVPYDLINNKNNASKTPKKEGKRYSNGYNINAIIKELYCLPEDYYLVFESKDKFTDSIYTKIHKITDISAHTGLHLEGNMLINSRLNGELISVKPLPNFIGHFITSLTFNKNQTSTTLGVKNNDKDYRSAFQALKALLDKYSEF
uniref:AlbA family DNA-binding domain-containing protein n=1 Tax=Flavobacterium sp. TaxID=239 RepID=UPI00404A1D32